MAEYHTVSRKPIFFRSCLRDLKDIADSADGVDHLDIEIPVHLVS